MKKVVALLILLFCFTIHLYGCAMPNYPSVCDNAPPDSYICQVATDMGMKVEDIDLFLQLANLRILDNKSKKVVLGFYDAVERVLISDLTYSALVTFVQDRVKLTAPEILIISRYLPMFSVPQVISDFDKGLIYAHINNQRALLK